MSDHVTPSVEIVPHLCKSCLRCVEVCKPAVLHVNLEKSFNELGYQWVEYQGDGCTGCGACFYACPEPGAVIVYKKESAA